MQVPIPTPILRFIHIDNLYILLQRARLYAPKYEPDNGLIYKTIHNIDIQSERRTRTISCGPGGVIHDYVSFYFGWLSPMMLQLKTGQVENYNEGQDPLIYLVSTAQTVMNSGTEFVFSDGHGIAIYTDWFDDLSDLNQVDWNIIYQRYWADKINDLDRQRRKQAEFLVYKFCNWSLIEKIVVLNITMQNKVEEILSKFPEDMHKTIIIRKEWYY